jgi:hypothetical protein
VPELDPPRHGFAPLVLGYAIVAFALVLGLGFLA